jgi:GH18 family chitinase
MRNVGDEKEEIIASLDPRPPPEVEATPPPILNTTLQPNIPYLPPAGKNISTDIGLGWFKDHRNVTGDCKIIVALGGWTWSNNFAEVARNQTKRAVFAQSVKEFLDEWELDGIGMFSLL